MKKIGKLFKNEINDNLRKELAGIFGRELRHLTSFSGRYDVTYDKLRAL
jgi:hypothetical protein